MKAGAENLTSKNLKLNKYKQEIADLYTARSLNYDNNDWHWQIAQRLVEYSQVSSGQRVLDIATGTGHGAIASAQLVGVTGQVVAIDISTGMLEQAKKKAEDLKLNNIQFLLADAEALDFSEHSFDRIFCSSAFIWMSDLVKSLSLWREFLKPGGILGIHAFAETAFIGGVITQKIAESYGF